MFQNKANGKKKYVSPDFKTRSFSERDVLTLSGNDNTEGGEDKNWGGIE